MATMTAQKLQLVMPVPEIPEGVSGKDPKIDEALARATEFTQALTLAGTIDRVSGKTLVDVSALDTAINRFVESDLQEPSKEMFQRIGELGYAVWGPSLAPDNDGGVSFATVEFLVDSGYPVSTETRGHLLAKLGLVEARNWEEITAALYRFPYSPVAAWTDSKFQENFVKFVTAPLVGTNGAAGEAGQVAQPEAVGIDQFARGFMQASIKGEWWGTAIRWTPAKKDALRAVIAGLRKFANNVPALKAPLSAVGLPGWAIDLLIAALQAAIREIANALDRSLQTCGGAAICLAMNILPWVTC